MRYESYCSMCGAVVSFEYQNYITSWHCPICGQPITIMSSYDNPNNFAMLREIDNIEKALDRINKAVGVK